MLLMCLLKRRLLERCVVTGYMLAKEVFLALELLAEVLLEMCLLK